MHLLTYLLDTCVNYSTYLLIFQVSERLHVHVLIIINQSSNIMQNATNLSTSHCHKLVIDRFINSSTPLIAVDTLAELS